VGSVIKVLTIENLLGDQLTVPIEDHGGADGSRTHDLLNAIIPNLSRASCSWKKYPAFLTAERLADFLSFGSFLTEDSDKIRTAARGPFAFSPTMEDVCSAQVQAQNKHIPP
jgi:hypothetical protein